MNVETDPSAPRPVARRPPVEHSSAVDYASMKASEMIEHCGTDARRWAEAFVQYARADGVALEVGTVLGWFANAMLAARKERDVAVKIARHADVQTARAAYAEIGKALDSLDFAAPDGQRVHVSRAANAIGHLASALGLEPAVSQPATTQTSVNVTNVRAQDPDRWLAELDAKVRKARQQDVREVLRRGQRPRTLRERIAWLLFGD